MTNIKCPNCSHEFIFNQRNEDNLLEETFNNNELHLHNTEPLIKINEHPTTDDFERDPFETADEFNHRINYTYWRAGEINLNKERYDINNSTFNFTLNLQEFFKKKFKHNTEAYIKIDRFHAKDMYTTGKKWSIYGQTKALNDEILLQNLYVIFNGILYEIYLNDKTTINGRFIDNQDGTLSDKTTNLMWMRTCVGQIFEDNNVSGTPQLLSWNEAIVIKDTFAGYSDWRLPTKTELHTLVLCSSGECELYMENLSNGRCLGNFQRPTIDLEAFPICPSGWFWTSTLCESSKDAWYVNFDNGATNKSPKSDKNYVRLVRGL